MTHASPAGAIEGADDVTPVRPPDAVRIFDERAARFRTLARGHAAGRYLDLLALLAETQAQAARELPAEVDRGEWLSPVPLRADAWRRPDAWRQALDHVVRRLSLVPAPAETAAALSRLREMPAADIERVADAVLAPAAPADPAAAVFVAAALQSYWTTLAAVVPADLVRREPGGWCPACGSPPVAGVVLGDRPVRYLRCSLCATEWYLPRLTCAHCGSTADLSYCVVEGAPPGVKAEACGRCRRYLKLFYLEHVPAADPVADDVASLALDELMAGEGFARAGVNSLLTLP
jgi:FdhE protein